MMPLSMTPDGTMMRQADEKLLVRFYLTEQLNEARSNEAGISKYDDIEMIEIIIPGCRDNCIRKASDQDKQRFPRQYESFLNTNAERTEGTPLSHFPFIAPSERKELEYFNIYTGEGLVNLSDGYLDKIPLDLRPMIQKVKAFMEMAQDRAVVVKHAAENEALRNEINCLKNQIQEIISFQKETEKSNGNNNNEINTPLNKRKYRKAS